MAFCPNCGEKVTDEARICPNCGAALAGKETGAGEAAPAEKETAASGSGTFMSGGASKKNGKRLALFAGIGVAVLAVIAVIFVFARGGVKPSKDAFVADQTAFLKERLSGILPRNAAKSERFSSDLSLSASLSGSDDSLKTFSELLDGSALVLKLDAGENDALCNLVLNLKGSDVLEALIVLDEEKAAFSIPGVDDNCYVFDYRAIMERNGIDGSLLSAAAAGKEDRQARMERWKEIAGRYTDVVKTAITEDNLVIEEKAEYTLTQLNRTETGAFYTFTPTQEDIQRMLELLADTVQEDEALDGELQYLAGEYRVLSNASADLSELGALADAMEDGAEELSQSIRDNAPDIAKEIADSGFVWTLGTEGNAVRLIRFSDDSGAFAYERHEEGGAVQEALYLTDETGGTDFLVRNEYTAKERQYTGAVEMTAEGSKVRIDYDVDASKRSALGIPLGTYALDLSDLLPGLQLQMEVAEADGGTDHTVTVNGIGALTGLSLDNVEVTLHATDGSTAKRPSGKEVDLSDYSDEELSDLMQRIGTDIVMGMMSSPKVREILGALY